MGERTLFWGPQGKFTGQSPAAIPIVDPRSHICTGIIKPLVPFWLNKSSGLPDYKSFCVCRTKHCHGNQILNQNIVKPIVRTNLACICTYVVTMATLALVQIYITSCTTTQHISSHTSNLTLIAQMLRKQLTPQYFGKILVTMATLCPRNTKTCHAHLQLNVITYTKFHFNC